MNDLDFRPVRISLKDPFVCTSNGILSSTVHSQIIYIVKCPIREGKRRVIKSRDSKFIYFRRPVDDRGVFRTPVTGGKVERIVDLKDWHDAGWVGRYMGLDPTDAPLLLREGGHWLGSFAVYLVTKRGVSRTP